MNDFNLSIRRRLLVMLIAAIMAVWLVVLVLVHQVAGHEVEEVFDRDLVRSGRILQTLLLHEVREEQDVAVKVREVALEIGQDGLRRYPRLASIMRGYADDASHERLELVGVAERAGQRYGKGLTFVARYAGGGIMMRDSLAPDIPPTEDGLSDLVVDGQTWRIFSLTDADTGFLVQAAEPLNSRARLVRYITRNTLMPMLIALPLLGVIIWVVVGRALAPLQRVAREVEARAPEAVEPIDDSRSPREIQGLLRALNRLFGRTGDALQRERQFTADAAHELRTPLAAMKTHLQVAMAAGDAGKARQSMGLALQGVDRATHSVEQLLALARADAEQNDLLRDGSVDLHELAVWGVSAFSQQAYERGIDLGLAQAGHRWVPGDTAALKILLRNLIDNAVRYTPKGGEVTVSVTGAEGEEACLTVADNGPGVALEERERIFDRFYRGPEERAMTATGSGVGLSIVQRIARLHHAEIEIASGINGQGLAVTVHFAAGGTD